MKVREAGSVYIIAEAGVNHNGDLHRALALVDAAPEAGADAVKFQTFDAGKLASKDLKKAAYQTLNIGSQQSQYEMLKALELRREWHYDLQRHAQQIGIEFLSTAFDLDSLAFLETLNLPIYKVPSGELTNSPLLWRFARTGKPLVVSTGMATLAEVELALAVITHAISTDVEPASIEEVWKCWGHASARAHLSDRVTLLHCTSQYPTPMEEVNLRAMTTLAATFGLPVGYSDHTQGTLVPVAAVALGAVVIEKHFTLDRSLPGPDHLASLEPDELQRMIADLKDVGTAMGSPMKAPQASEWDTRRSALQQVIAARDIPAGATFVREDLGSARTGRGLPASHLWDMIGRVANRSYAAGENIES